LPYVVQTNVRALANRAPNSSALKRFDEIAQIVTGKASAKATDAVAWVQDLRQALETPSLSEFGLTRQDLPTAVAKAQKSSSMKGNPITLTDEELMGILTKAC